MGWTKIKTRGSGDIDGRGAVRRREPGSNIVLGQSFSLSFFLSEPTGLGAIGHTEYTSQRDFLSGEFASFARNEKRHRVD